MFHHTIKIQKNYREADVRIAKVVVSEYCDTVFTESSVNATLTEVFSPQRPSQPLQLHRELNMTRK